MLTGGSISAPFVDLALPKDLQLEFGLWRGVCLGKRRDDCQADGDYRVEYVAHDYASGDTPQGRMVAFPRCPGRMAMLGPSRYRACGQLMDSGQAQGQTWGPAV